MGSRWALTVPGEGVQVSWAAGTWCRAQKALASGHQWYLKTLLTPSKDKHRIRLNGNVAETGYNFCSCFFMLRGWAAPRQPLCIRAKAGHLSLECLAFQLGLSLS